MLLVLVVGGDGLTLKVGALGIVGAVLRLAGVGLVVISSAFDASLNTLTVLTIRHLFAAVRDLFELTAVIKSCSCAE